ncbi:MAG TPA: hypothetical protein VMI06_04505 [Terriglobia bacterium]|nr:hypothetical protein [Terriglobia bacterium]
MRKWSWVLFVALIITSVGYPQAVENTHSPVAARSKDHSSLEARKRSKASPKTAGLNSAEKLHLISVGVPDPKGMPEAPPLLEQSLRLKAPTANSKAQAGPSTANAAVSEFQTESHNFGASSGGLVVPSSHSRESALKSIHGEVDGALAGGSVGANQADGAVGATSKSGKTSIFLQTSHATVQEPH